MFHSKPQISTDLGDWILDSFEWVMQRKGPQKWRSATPLVRPTREFFDVSKGEDVKTAAAIGAAIMDLLGMDNPSIRIEPLPVLPDEISHQYGKLSDVGGEYWHDADDPLITYDPRLMRQPVLFISTLTHELMHAHLANVVDKMPGGDMAHELSTDLHCITHGFGLFQLEAAEVAGWAGYMTQPSRAFALAVFLELTETPTTQALPFLSSRSAKRLKRAQKDIRRFWADDLAALKANH